MKNHLKSLYLLKNSVKEYDWGDPYILPKLLHYTNSSDKPQAEVWMGTYPNAESIITYSNKEQLLSDLINSDPYYFLGEKYLKKFSLNSLPFLYKILSINKPLSLQAHPNKKQAQIGFDKENKAHISLQSTKRSYRDNNHKIELFCAYSSNVWLLCGFLPYDVILKNFDQIEHPIIKNLVDSFKKNLSDKGLSNFLYELLHLTQKDSIEILSQIKYIQNCDEHTNNWLSNLINYYPDDITSLSPLYMNLIYLPQGKAIFIESGTLHVYLQGVGIEITTPSDNTLRFGLTSKHIDTENLKNVVNFNTLKPSLISPEQHNGVYKIPYDNFLLSRHYIDSKHPYILSIPNHTQIVLCMKGNLTITSTDYNYNLTQGKSLFIPYAAGNYRFIGSGEIFIASTTI